MVLRELVTILGFKADDRALISYESEMQKLKKSMLIAVAAATALGAALFGVANSAAKAGDELDKTLRLVDLSAEKFQLLRGAAELQGVGPEKFTKGIEKLNRLIGMARQGMQTSLKPFQTLGVNLRNAQGDYKGTYQLLLDMADAFVQLKNPTDRMAVSQEAFGKTGAGMINLMSGGSQGIRDLMEEFSKYTFLLDNKAIKASAKFRDQLFLFQTAIKGVKNQIGELLIPSMNKTVRKMLDWITANKKLIASDLGKTISAITTAFKWLGYALDTVISAVNAIITLFQRFMSSITPLEGKIVKLVLVVGLLDAAFAIIPITIASIVLVLDDINTYMAGGDSVIGRLAKKFPLAFAMLKKALHEAKKVIYDTIILPLEYIFFLLKKIYDLAQKLGGFAATLNKVGDVLSQSVFGIPLATTGKNLMLAALSSGTKQGSGGRHMNVNTTIHMTVPSGTATAQQDFLKQTAGNVFDNMFNEELNKTLINFQRLEQ